LCFTLLSSLPRLIPRIGVDRSIYIQRNFLQVQQGSMSMVVAVRVVALVIATKMMPAGALYSQYKEVISDITTSESDEFSAMQIKAEMFWKPIVTAAEDVKMEEHLALYADAEAVITGLPAENVYVRQALREALDHLKSADDASFKQALATSRMAKEKLEAPCDISGDAFSFVTGGQNFLKAALKRFVGAGRYADKLVEHTGQRQADVLPILRGAAGVTGDILSDCRLASKKGFDVRKYSLYNRNVPKTPKIAKDVADRIIDAATETRRRFTRGITGLVASITRDFQEKEEGAAATVTKASLHGLHATIAKAEEHISSSSSSMEVGADVRMLPSKGIQISSSIFPQKIDL